MNTAGGLVDIAFVHPAMACWFRYDSCRRAFIPTTRALTVFEHGLGDKSP